MRNVTVDRDDFLAKVSANRDGHREVFEEALEAYRRLLQRELQQRISDLKRGLRIDQ